MQVELITNPDVIANHQQTWNALAPNPFMDWGWLGAWWNHYGRGEQLFVLAMKEGDEYIGFAPWYLDQGGLKGTTIKFLGSGHVCSDHLTLMCKSQHSQACAIAVAEWLAESDAWDQMELIGVDQDDPAIDLMMNLLESGGLTCHRQAGMSCFAIDLPATWSEFQSRRSKSGKYECRKIKKWIDEERFQFHCPQTTEELEACWFEFVDLHQRRRHSLGEKGCFDFPPFGSFLWEASSNLLPTGQFQLTMIYQADVPIAAQYSLKNDDAFYFYQSGINTDYLKQKPGQTMLYQTINQSIEDGRKCFDMLRGDEAYKLRWRGTERRTEEFRVAANRLRPRLRHAAWQTRVAAKSIRSALSRSLRGDA